MNSEELVVGDIFEFKAGMRIPADSIIIEVSPNKDNNMEGEPEPYIECNEGDVTGYFCQQNKGVLKKEAIFKNSGNALSNILYAQSFVVSGSGKAIVCCVGQRTQWGLPVDIETDISLEKKKTPFKEVLEKYSHRMGGYTNKIVLMLIILIIIRATLEWLGILQSGGMGGDSDGEQPDLAEFLTKLISKVLKMVTVYIALIIALLPEAVTMAFAACIVSYTEDEALSETFKIMFNELKCLETAGQVGFICLDLNDKDLKTLKEKEPKIVNLLKYFSQLKDIQLVVLSTHGKGDLEEFMRHIDPGYKEAEVEAKCNESLFDAANTKSEIGDSTDAKKKITISSIQDAGEFFDELRKMDGYIGNKNKSLYAMS